MRIGIDPGVTGALALLNKDLEMIHVEDMPVMVVNKNRQQVNPAELSKILDRWKKIVNEPLYAFLEQVSAMPGQGVCSMFSFGVSYGIVQGVLASDQIPFIMVRPNEWKKRAGLIGAEKDKARTVAQQLFPSASLARKKDIGRADALLIARYGERK